MVVGNMIGSGIFLLPASLAIYGAISIVGWICAAIGALALSVMFGYLARYAPDDNGGPYMYSLRGLGPFAAFLVAWGYWIAIWTTNAAIAVALVGYLSIFIPILSEHLILAAFTGLVFIWLFSWINTQSISKIASVQVTTTILKVVPLVLLAFVGLFFMNTAYYAPFNMSEVSDISAITSTTALTLFAFLGMESAGIINAETQDAAVTVRRSTIIGTLITAFVYIMSSIAIIGLLPAADLAASNAPFADAASVFWGDRAKYIIAGCAVFATMGALNGWILMQGRIPLAAAREGLFPPIFGKTNSQGAPRWGIVISSGLASILMYFNYSKGLVGAFTFMIMLSTLSCLIPYLFSAASLAILSFRDGKSTYHPLVLISLFCFIFCIWAIYGCGYEVTFYGFLLLLAGIPFYVLSHRRKL